MKHTIGLEWINQGREQPLRDFTQMMDSLIPGTWEVFNPGTSRPWVARIVGPHFRLGLERQMVPSRTDYSGANRKGTRGVRLWFVVEERAVHEVCYWASWSRKERYFARWEDGKEIRMGLDDVWAWLNKDYPEEDWSWLVSED